jgi:hypothetical protein
MARQFKPVRFLVVMGLAAFVVCGVTVFYTHRAAHGRTAEERTAYWTGEKAGEQAAHNAKLPTAAELNVIAQKSFQQQGSGEPLPNLSPASGVQALKQAFENGYTEGFKKTHPQ